VLLQLPPNLQADPARLDACLAAFATSWPVAADGAADGAADAGVGGGGGPGRAVKVAVEPRHPSWWTNETRQVLAARGAALCWADQLGRPVGPLWQTANWGYLRFHQGAAAPWPRYGARALSSWLDRLTRAWPAEAPVYVYFNNDQNGAAIADSAAFSALAGRLGRPVTRTP